MRSCVISLAVLASIAALCAPVKASDVVDFKIWNKTQFTMTQLYVEYTSSGRWTNNLLYPPGYNDNPLSPGSYYEEEMEQTDKYHCPSLRVDVRAVFSNGSKALMRAVDVCKHNIEFIR